MVGRPDVPKQGKTAIALGLLLFAAPVLAAPDHDILCEDHHQATLEIAATELVVSPVSHEPETAAAVDETQPVSADRLLRPRFDATVREIFADDDDETEVEAEETESVTEDPAVLRIRVPGVSDEDLVRYKRRMFRRDI